MLAVYWPLYQRRQRLIGHAGEFIMAETKQGDGPRRASSQHNHSLAALAANSGRQYEDHREE